MIKDTSGQDVKMPQANKTKRYLKTTALIALCSAIVMTAMAFQHNATQAISAKEIKIATVERGDLTRDVVAMGKVVAANAPTIYSPEQGYVELLVRAGDAVAFGQVVALVHSPELNNELKQQKSELARLQGELGRKELDARRQTLSLNKQLDLASVELNAAERENRRAQLSIKQNLISQIDLEKAVDDLAKAKLSHQHARQDVVIAKDTVAFELDAAKNMVERQALVVEELERQVHNLEITASVSGIVGNLNVQTRALVSKNQALMTLVDLSAYEAQVQVAESYANELGLGMAVELKIGNQQVLGTLTAISPEVNDREVTTRVRFEQSDLQGIRQNQQLSARILLDSKHNILKVRRGTFVQSGGHVAYKLNGNIAERIDVQLGANSLREVEILDGLDAGDQIIISSYDQFNQAPSVLIN
ncbi:ABC transporter permease [Pseudoalteromonas luteoviolacea B = ATCC 29581]|nr:ABC transporter permease [Pseudoalteromonas luteoviolacea B = ATCC 29581]